MSSPISPAAGDAAATATAAEARLAHLPVTLFSIVMGLAGLAIAWGKVLAGTALAQPGSLAIGIIASGVLILLLLCYATKIVRHRAQVVAELHHPVRINFFPTLSISLLLLSVVWQPWPSVALPLWLTGAALQLGLTLLVMSSWIHHGHFAIHHASPAWFIPVVGNIVVPLSGSHFGFIELSWFFFSIGLLFWLVLLTIVMYRLFFHEPLPQRMTPTLFILLAPPSVGFVAYTSLIGGLDQGARVLYYSALFLALLLANNAARFWRTPFFLSSWAFSFPLAALAIASARMAQLGQLPLLNRLAQGLLLLLTLIVLWLVARTLMAVRQQQICVAE